MAAALWTNEPQSTYNHEVLGHGTVGVAQQQNRVGELDPVGQAVSYLQQSKNPVAQGLGLVGDEARGYGMERAYPAYLSGASPTQQALAGLQGGAGDFLFNRNRPDSYAAKYQNDARAARQNPRGSLAGYANNDYGPEAFQSAANIMRLTGGLGGVYRGAKDTASALAGALTR
jgi:hypothetical protein